MGNGTTGRDPGWRRACGVTHVEECVNQSESVHAIIQDLNDHPDWIPVITEGDSWFAFPGVLLRMNVISHLQYTFRARMAFLRVSYHGDRLHDMLNGSQYRKLRRMLGHKTGFRAMLFSGGGNDLIQSMDSFVTNIGKCRRWRPCLVGEALDQKIVELESLYHKLIRTRDTYNPTCHIYTHSYDYSSVNGKPVKLGGLLLSHAWLEPMFLEKGITSKRSQRRIVRHVIDEFYAMLKRVERACPERFTVIDTRGTLKSEDWADEIHPSHEGFERIARKIARQLAKDFPGYIRSRARRDAR